MEDSFFEALASGAATEALQDILGLIRSCGLNTDSVDLAKFSTVMPANQSDPRSSADSSRANDWLDLDLPEITEKNAPVEHPQPTTTLAHEHSVALSGSAPEEVWEERRRLMNPERFVM